MQCNIRENYLFLLKCILGASERKNYSSLGGTNTEMLHSIVYLSVRHAKIFSSGCNFEINLEYMKTHVVKCSLL